jgi:hypothetical protein
MRRNQVKHNSCIDTAQHIHGQVEPVLAQRAGNESSA